MPSFLDSNVFLYAIGAEHPLREPCGAVLERVGSGQLHATTSTEVVQEVIHVLRRKGRHAQALIVARRLIALFPDMLAVGPADMDLACDLLERYPDLPTRDAVHAATALNHGMDSIISADQDFDRIKEIERRPPA